MCVRLCVFSLFVIVFACVCSCVIVFASSVVVCASPSPGVIAPSLSWPVSPWPRYSNRGTGVQGHGSKCELREASPQVRPHALVLSGVRPRMPSCSPVLMPSCLRDLAPSHSLVLSCSHVVKTSCSRAACPHAHALVRSCSQAFVLACPHAIMHSYYAALMPSCPHALVPSCSCPRALVLSGVRPPSSAWLARSRV